MIVQCLYALEKFSYADFDDFAEYIQDVSLDEDTSHLFQVLLNSFENFQPKKNLLECNSESSCLKLHIMRIRLSPIIQDRVQRPMYQLANQILIAQKAKLMVLTSHNGQPLYSKQQCATYSWNFA